MLGPYSYVLVWGWGQVQLAEEIEINSSLALIENISMFLTARLQYKKPALNIVEPTTQNNCSGLQEIRPCASLDLM